MNILSLKVFNNFTSWEKFCVTKILFLLYFVRLHKSKCFTNEQLIVKVVLLTTIQESYELTKLSLKNRLRNAVRLECFEWRECPKFLFLIFLWLFYES